MERGSKHILEQKKILEKNPHKKMKLYLIETSNAI